ncbi:MAG: cobalt-zinc-cadmium efflux system protein [Chthoniobacter sp.]|nr:cobalt-zinc-cadmium efflux system protein [Chthoniobacter sp.]
MDNHGHEHGHVHSPPSNTAAFAIGVALNLAFVVVEVVYGLTAHSLALLSDAGHNLSDVFGLLVAWGAIHLSKSLPTKHRTYGLRRSSILAALTNAIVLLVVVGGITWEAIGRFFHPEAVAGSTVIWVAAAGVVINSATALLFMAGRKRDLNIKGAFLHMAGDAAVSLGVVGIGFAIRSTGWHWLDPALSILISGVIVCGTWGLLRESVNLVMDAVPEGIDPHAVEAYLADLTGVQAVHDLHIWGMSTTESALTVHLVMPEPPADDKFLHDVVHELHEQFEIGHVTIQIEHGSAGMPCHQKPAHVV